MEIYSYNSCAKINLALEILYKRPDGYHQINSIFIPISLSDHIHFRRSNKFILNIEPETLQIPIEKNLIYKTFKLMQNKFKLHQNLINVHLEKKIPMGAGLGGGSSNAGTTLRALNDIYYLDLSLDELRQIAKGIGADVPFFVNPKPSIVGGIGEIITPITFNYDFHIILVYPRFQISTKYAYSLIPYKKRAKEATNFFDIVKKVKSPTEFHSYFVNDFEPYLFQHFPKLYVIKQILYNLGASFAGISGSGSTVFGIFESEFDLDKLKFLLPNTDIYITKIINLP